MEELPEAGERLEAVGRRFVVGPALSLWPPPPPPLEPLPPPRLLLEDRSFAWCSCTQACYLYIGHHQVQSPSYIPRWHSGRRSHLTEHRCPRTEPSTGNRLVTASASVSMFLSVNVSQCQCPATDGIPRSQTICDAPLQIFASGRPTR